MNILKHYFTLAVAAAGLLWGTTACNSDDDGDDNNLEHINFVIDADQVLVAVENGGSHQGTGLWTSFGGPRINVHFDVKAGKADLSINQLQLADGKYITFKTEGNTFKVNDNERTVTVEVPELTVDGAAVKNFKFFVCMQFPYIYSVNVTGEVDGAFFSVMPIQNYVYGRTTITSLENPSDQAFYALDTYYNVRINRLSQTAAITVKDAQFAAAMPKMDLEFANLPVAFTRNGVTIASPEFIPTAKGTPYPQFKITNFDMRLNSTARTTMGFDCAGKYHALFEGFYTFLPEYNKADSKAAEPMAAATR